MLSLLLAALVPQGPGTSTAPVVINEFQYDDSVTDDREFVELFNRSPVPVDISGWVLRNPDPTPTGVVPTYTVPANTILLPGGFWVFGSALVANVTQVVGTQDLWENDNEALELLDTTGTIVDSVCYELHRGAWGVHPLEGDGLFGDFLSTDASPTSYGRFLDGYDTNDNGRDFGIGAVSPGASNNLPVVTPYAETFDLGPPGTIALNFLHSFVIGRSTDPGVLGIVPSPQGGLCSQWHDAAGGGNSNYFQSAPMTDVVVECWVHFSAPMTPVDPNVSYPNVPPTAGFYAPSDGEAWAIGVRGSTDLSGKPDDLPGDYYTIVSPGVGSLRQPGSTGVAWYHFRTPNYSRLYLVDLNDGYDPVTGADFTVIAGPIDILPSITDGWQRLRLHVQGNKVVANFGGTYGFDDGIRVAATIPQSLGLGGVYLKYREAIFHNVLMRPLTLDDLQIRAPTTTQSFLGVASPTTTGTPAIDSNGFLIPGSTGFAVTGTGMVPAGAPNFALSGLLVGFSSFLPGITVPGTPPTVRGYVLPIEASFAGLANAAGAVSFPLPLPATNAYMGVNVSFQLVDLDLALPYPVPIGSSRGMDMVMGR